MIKTTIYEERGKAVWALVFGIASGASPFVVIIFSLLKVYFLSDFLFFEFNFFFILFGLIGLILSILGIIKKKKFAIGALIFSIVGLVIWVLIIYLLNAPLIYGL